jgi:hypothetical protein
MTEKCKKCGGSGDMFVMEKGKQSVIVAFRDMAAHKKDGYKPTGSTICCSICNGLGVVEAD